MALRVELIDEAVRDLASYARSGGLPLFLKKLIRLEEVGKEAGLPLGGSLSGWRKIIVGDRNWRIVFTTDPDETVATVWVIGDRADAECYAEALRRVEALGEGKPEAASLAAVMLELIQLKCVGLTIQGGWRSSRRRSAGPVRPDLGYGGVILRMVPFPLSVT